MRAAPGRGHWRACAPQQHRWRRAPGAGAPRPCRAAWAPQPGPQCTPPACRASGAQSCQCPVACRSARRNGTGMQHNSVTGRLTLKAALIWDDLERTFGYTKSLCAYIHHIMSAFGKVDSQTGWPAGRNFVCADSSRINEVQSSRMARLERSRRTCSAGAWRSRRRRRPRAAQPGCPSAATAALLRCRAWEPQRPQSPLRALVAEPPREAAPGPASHVRSISTYPAKILPSSAYACPDS